MPYSGHTESWTCPGPPLLPDPHIPHSSGRPRWHLSSPGIAVGSDSMSNSFWNVWVFLFVQYMSICVLEAAYSKDFLALHIISTPACLLLSLLVLSSAIFHACSGISTSCSVSHQFLQVPKAMLAACWTVSLASVQGVTFSITGESSSIYNLSFAQLYFLPSLINHSQDLVLSVMSWLLPVHVR